MASTSRDRDKGQKYLSGNQKWALAKAKAAENEHIEDEESKNNSENDNRATSPIIVDEYNDEIDNKLENDDAAMNQVEDNVNTPEDSTKVGSLLITDEDHGQRSHNDGSSMSTVVVNISDDPAS